MRGGPVPEQDWLAIMAGKQKPPADMRSPVADDEPEQDWLKKLADKAPAKVAAKDAMPAVLRAIPTDLPYTDPGATSAAAGGFTRNIPVIGPWLDEKARHAAAAIRSAIYKTPFDEELKAVNDYADRTTKEHPVADTVGGIGGAVTGMGVLGLAAPAAMGLSGPLLTRMAAGGGSGAIINALDARVRSHGDPYQTAVGGAVGGAFGLGGPLAGRVVGAGTRAALGMKDTAQSYLLQRAADLGIPVRPPQTSTSGFVKKVDQMVGQLPGGGGAKDAAKQTAAVERAVANTFGANDLSQAEMSGARNRLGDAFEDVKKRMMAAHDLPFQDTVDSVLGEAKRIEAPARERVESLVDHVVSHFDEDGTMPGELFHSLTQKGSFLDRTTKNENSDVRYAATKLRDALDSSAIRWSDPEDSAKFAQTKLAWKNMKTVEPLATKPLTTAGLRQAVNTSFKDRAYTGTGKSDLGDIVDIAERYMQQPRDSGTPVGNVIMSGLTHVPKLGLGLAGAGYGYGSGGSPWDIAQDAAIGLAGTATMAKATRILLNNPGLLAGVLSRAQYAAPAARRSLLTVTPNSYSDQDQDQQ
jgi:hypothetical protein